MNLFCLVGQIEELPVLKELNSKVKTCSLKLKVTRPFANSEGVYEVDHITIEVWRGLAETICDVAKVDAWISVKGRIASRLVERESNTYCFYTFIAESLGYLTGDLHEVNLTK